MTPTTHALLICVIFLCWLDETVLSQHGLCAKDQCFALFQEPEDFPGAQKRCKDSDGQLLTSVQVLTSLLSGLSGTYWMELPGTKTTAEEAAARLQNCSSVSALMGLNFTLQREPCHEKLDGFLCQYTLTEPCSRLQAGVDAQVKYTTTTFMGFEVKDSAVFPLGTIAVAGKVGVEYPDSKHICYTKNWIRAPWSCEVMQGGCEHSCSDITHTCICPAGQTLHPNNITCMCDKGYRLAQDGKSCVDVDECKEEESPCTNEGEECMNTPGGFECWCQDGFSEEDGVCVNVTICQKCEHIKCEKFNGVYECVCRRGFRVSPQDPTKCEQYCTEQDCLAKCIPNPELEKKGQHQCFCPEGYIQDIQNNIPICTDINECENERQCDHTCENSFGSYRCLCDEGYELHGEHTCVLEDEDGSGTSPVISPHSTPASAHPVTVPSYIKTGSVLGITLFMALCAALLYFVVRNMVKRCGKLELTSLKRPDMDIFSLQQVTTETYKRLSFDLQFKNDSQRL